MSYQVLARKWRPNTFAEMAGQEHVLKALINALDSDRLHHAYLFTGTRGVGKTTIARILAKCLNCEEGVTSTPCGVCNSCQEIAAGKFIDLVEVDAATRRGIDNMLELLENLQYAPAKARFKIYLIDEVHMLTKESFTALLKTLEEPPPHVKFLFATTDPERLPITVLSRCLQFNLKNLSAERISQHLQFVLEEEKLTFEESALWALARAADGSMRDALSLTDQAIGHGDGQIIEADVNSMLGTIDRAYAIEICRALTQGQGSEVLATISKMAELSPDYDTVLTDMLSIWHQVSILQTVPDALDKGVSHYSEMLELAASVPAEDIQLFYQICLLGRQDLSMAPDLRSGFEMVVLRAIAFRPDTAPPSKVVPSAVKNSPEPAKKESPEPAKKESPEPAKKESPEPAKKESPKPKSDNRPDGASEGVGSAVKKSQADSSSAQLAQTPEPSVDSVAKTTKEPLVDTVKEKQSAAKIALQDFSPDNWLRVRKQLSIGASLGEIASHCLYVERQGHCLSFVIDNEQTSLYDAAHEQGLAKALCEYFGESVTVEIKFGATHRETPRAADKREKAERLAEAVDTLNQDPDIIKIKKLFNARLDEKTVRPID